MRIVHSVPHLAAAVAFIAVCSLAQCAAARGEEPGPQNGIASWYGKGHVGRRTANGEIHDSRMATAAHLRLPFGSRVKVINRKTGVSVVVRINDRGPFVKGRIIDLSERAARDLGLLADGIAPVSISLIKPQERTWRIASR
ncbi:septal ring lytic transglycosylase RlpA family protein [Magnetospirillum fulvum]|uniref:Endolytic peptidoglycan transglycosylase RlpA n=1 Tax=Magnetospirillum fulvum TaxID=1082 RepID=A0A1H6HZN3_MAGFU|nr:septal ring lytic transglycosylase RlpA family protein [Magnetospirillum fulvum]SEH41207.1 rare lipoprotein A [Magnetospirillum fulvum]